MKYNTPSIIALAFIYICVIGCESESTTESPEIAVADSINAFYIRKDTTIIDAMFDYDAFPKAIKKNDSTLSIEQMIQVSCGYADFEITKILDTLILSAKPATGRACVDWTAGFYYQADVVIDGKCNIVKFRGDSNFLKGKSDTLITLK